MPTPPNITGNLYLCDTASTGKFLLMSSQVSENLGVKGHRFWLLDADGKTIDEFGPRFDCDCEYSFHTVYELRDATLFKYFGKENDCALTPRLRRWTSEVVCHVQRELSRDDPDTSRLLARASDDG